jgi:hypothetical protein
MDGSTNILYRGVSQNINFAGFGIDFHIHNVGGESRSYATGCHRYTCYHRTACLIQAGG